jgi:hypothetical protein
LANESYASIGRLFGRYEDLNLRSIPRRSLSNTAAHEAAYASGGNKYGQYCSVVKIAQTVISSYASVQSSKFRGAVAAVARLVCEELRFPSSGAFLFPKSRKSPFRGPFISDVPGLIG